MSVGNLPQPCEGRCFGFIWHNTCTCEQPNLGFAAGYPKANRGFDYQAAETAHLEFLSGVNEPSEEE